MTATSSTSPTTQVILSLDHLSNNKRIKTMFIMQKSKDKGVYSRLHCLDSLINVCGL